MLEFEQLQFADRRQRYDDGERHENASKALDYPIKFESEDPVEFVDADMSRPSWELVRECRFGYEPGGEAVGERVLSGNLDRLTCLRIEGVLDDRLLERLQKLSLPSLNSLELHGCGGCSPTVVASLATSDFFPRLKHLSLPDGRPDGLDALFQEVERTGGTLNGLRSLELDSGTVKQLQSAHRIGMDRVEQIGGLDTQAIEWLSQEPSLSGRLKALNGLVLNRDGNASGDRVIRALCSGHFSQLEEVRLAFDVLDEPAVLSELGRSCFASTLKRLHLRGCGLSDAGWVALSDSGLQQLRELNLSHTDSTSMGAERLFQSSLMGRLQKLFIVRNRLDAASYSLLSRNLSPGIQELEMAADGDGRDGLRHVLSADRFERLSRIQVVSYSGEAQLDFGWIPQKVRESLRQFWFGNGEIAATDLDFKLPQLESLKLSGEFQTESVWSVILHCDRLRDLQLTNLGEIPPRRIRQITESEFAKSLINLEFAYCSIDDEGARILAASDMSPVGLWLGDSDLSTEGLRAILQSTVSDRLNFLSLEDEPEDVSTVPKHCYFVTL